MPGIEIDMPTGLPPVDPAKWVRDPREVGRAATHDSYDHDPENKTDAISKPVVGQHVAFGAEPVYAEKGVVVSVTPLGAEVRAFNSNLVIPFEKRGKYFIETVAHYRQRYPDWKPGEGRGPGPEFQPWILWS
jgi:hypothetical protein